MGQLGHRTFVQQMPAGRAFARGGGGGGHGLAGKNGQAEGGGGGKQGLQHYKSLAFDRANAGHSLRVHGSA
ncbi:hypothetical protein D3C75_1243350 [compost metagenome]